MLYCTDLASLADKNSTRHSRLEPCTQTGRLYDQRGIRSGYELDEPAENKRNVGLAMMSGVQKTAMEFKRPAQVVATLMVLALSRVLDVSPR